VPSIFIIAEALASPKGGGGYRFQSCRFDTCDGLAESERSAGDLAQRICQLKWISTVKSDNSIDIDVVCRVKPQLMRLM